MEREIATVGFRECPLAEAQFPRITLTGDSVNKGARVLSGTPNPFVVCVTFLSSFSSLFHAQATAGS